MSGLSLRVRQGSSGSSALGLCAMNLYGGEMIPQGLEFFTVKVMFC
jgi:hypothetical protein